MALVASHWTPRTREQREAVERLGRECGGVLVRSLPDGAAEVLAVERGAYNRYLVREDATGVIVESRPRDWRWPLGDVLGWAALVLVFGITILLYAVLALAGVADAGFWALIPFAFGMILLVVAFVIGPWPYRLMHPGDRRADWDQVGWPEH
jgi:hypothetical protein